MFNEIVLDHDGELVSQVDHVATLEVCKWMFVQESSSSHHIQIRSRSAAQPDGEQRRHHVGQHPPLPGEARDGHGAEIRLRLRLFQGESVSVSPSAKIIMIKIRSPLLSSACRRRSTVMLSISAFCLHTDEFLAFHCLSDPVAAAEEESLKSSCSFRLV